MKPYPLFGMFVILALPLRHAVAADNTSPAPVKVEPLPKTNRNSAIPPIRVVPGVESAGQPAVYDQKPVPGRTSLVQPQQAQAIVDRFKVAYPKLGSPRVLIYVNRELIDEKSGLKMIARTEKVEVTENKGDAGAPTDPTAKAPDGDKRPVRTEKSIRENRFQRDEAPERPLADKQTVRDVERLFGRPLRMGGANLADQRIAAQLLGGKPFEGASTEGEQARKDREALSKVADVVVEVLISSKNVQVAELSGDRTYSVPDIQATAIRLSDSKILGQAASSDITGRGTSAGQYDVREVAEATALALMEDMMTGVE